MPSGVEMPSGADDIQPRDFIVLNQLDGIGIHILVKDHLYLVQARTTLHS